MSVSEWVTIHWDRIDAERRPSLCNSRQATAMVLWLTPRLTASWRTGGSHVFEVAAGAIRRLYIGEEGSRRNYKLATTNSREQRVGGWYILNPPEPRATWSKEDNVHKPLIQLILSLVVPFLALTLFFDQGLQAASQQGPPRTVDRLSGTVRPIDKNTKTITVKTRGVRTPRQVLCDGNTKLTNPDHQPGTLDTLKKDQTIVCTGTFNDQQ